MSDETTSELTTVATARNEFEAETIVVVLRDAGIRALALPASGKGVDPSSLEVHVRVPADDRARAEEALRSQREASRALPEPDDQPRTPRGMPVLARISFVVAVIIVLVTIAAMVAVWVV